MHLTTTDITRARTAGALYAVIIACGIGAEVALRGRLIDYASAASTAEAIRNGAGAFRAAFAADIVMAISDAALAVLLYLLLRATAPGMALAAMVFRLVQTVLIGAGLLMLWGAFLLLSSAQDLGGLATGQTEGIALMLLNLHAHGYDLGLIFFGINSVLTGLLLRLSGLLPGWVGAGLVVAGAVYLAGSSIRFFAPDLMEAFAPAYGLCVLAEGAVRLGLLLKGRGRQAIPA